MVEKIFFSNQGHRYNEICILGLHSNMPRTVTSQRYRSPLDYNMFYFADRYNCMDRSFKDFDVTSYYENYHMKHYISSKEKNFTNQRRKDKNILYVHGYNSIYEVK